MIRPGETVFDAKRRITALVRADGTLQIGNTVGSIHRIGAIAQGAEACNGWSFWHVDRNKKLQSIDEFRAEIRESIAAAAE
jgi:modification methylase